MPSTVVTRLGTLLAACLLMGLAACGGGSGGSDGTPNDTSPAALAARLGRPNRLLVGLGSTNLEDVQAQGVGPDIFDRYLVGVDTNGSGDWTQWNSPAGAYVNVVAAQADSMGAVPMFTLYQMASQGDGNLSILANRSFMEHYWANVVLMFRRIALYGKPALVNFEPDFWGYVERRAPHSDPAQLFAYVNVADDCAALPNNAASIAPCAIKLARKYAPKAVIGFPPSSWGGNTTDDVISFMNRAGAAKADFIVMQTSDRDAGCFEARTDPDCQRDGNSWYWDETNQAHPNFHDHLQDALAYRQGIGHLPLIWWQTPLGVPADSPGTPYHWRDNRMHYFLTHPAELTAAGGLAVVFGAGASTQTTLTTDGGQYQTLFQAYLADPAPLQ